MTCGEVAANTATTCARHTCWKLTGLFRQVARPDRRASLAAHPASPWQSPASRRSRSRYGGNFRALMLSANDKLAVAFLDDIRQSPIKSGKYTLDSTH